MGPVSTQHCAEFGELRWLANTRLCKLDTTAGGHHHVNHTIPLYCLDDRSSLLRHVDVRRAAGWSSLSLYGLSRPVSRAVASWSKASCLGLALRNARWFESSWGKKFSHEISASVWDRCPPSIVIYLGNYDRSRLPFSRQFHDSMIYFTSRAAPCGEPCAGQLKTGVSLRRCSVRLGQQQVLLQMEPGNDLTTGRRRAKSAVVRRGSCERICFQGHVLWRREERRDGDRGSEGRNPENSRGAIFWTSVENSSIVLSGNYGLVVKEERQVSEQQLLLQSLDSKPASLV
ncbi:hypothetical protein ANN_04666 [Periplaneta americana]|uniref:Uncharacterized protein n=1 Tax=Periplaneta americana TaxID=6978 RepID=A0ABQ8TA93_PERAM|nr:hypothetical protein ANN_04666 [Periplaneta americana]